KTPAPATRKSGLDDLVGWVESSRPTDGERWASKTRPTLQNCRTNMAKKRAKQPEPPKTTAQQLGSLIKSARDIMRKDKGLNGDLDRLPLLTWIMFLKFLDDREKLEEARAGIAGKKYKSAVEAPYRWRD